VSSVSLPNAASCQASHSLFFDKLDIGEKVCQWRICEYARIGMRGDAARAAQHQIN
jgi:hypothetical protein